MRQGTRMSGLLSKAQSLRGSSPKSRIPGSHAPHAQDDDGISPEEKEKILAQIEDAVSRGRLQITGETFQFTPRRRGGVMPVIVNGAAILVIAAGVLLALFFSRRAEQNIVAPPVAILSAESKMVETLKEESQAQLAGKDREIASIREKIAGFDGERARVRQDAEALVRQKEQDLQASFDAALAAERKRLEASGLSEKAVSDRLAAYEARNSAAMDAQLAAFRAQADADRAAREKEIASLQTQYQQTLQQAQSERTKIQDDAARRQAELEAGYKQKQLSLEKDTAAAQAELQRLRDQQAGEQLVLDQILSWYQKVRDQIQAARPDAALTALADFRAYLNSQNLGMLPAVAARRPVDLFLIDSLGELIRSQVTQAAQSAQVAQEPQPSQGPSAADIQDLTASANLIAAVAAAVQTGDEAFQAQGYAKARELYLSALARIPAVQAGYEKLGQIEAMFADQKKKDVSAALASANAAYKSGDYDGAAARYAQALSMMQGDRAAADSLVGQLQEIGALRKAAQDAALTSSMKDAADVRARTLTALAALRARLAAAASRGSEAAAARNTLVALLETKLLVQKTLLAPEVVKEHPTLYDDLNRYLDALAAQSGADARLQTLRDLDAMLGSASGAPQVSDDVLKRYAPADQQDLLLSVLDKLQALVR